MKHKYRTRVQGESLQVKISEIEWNITETIMYPAVFFVLTIWVWLAAVGFMTFNWLTAVFMSIVTAVLAIRAYRKVKEDRTKLKAYRKGLEGERLVGESLNSLSDNCTTFVFHDIPGERFNVDHIVVSTRGIFAIETKHFDRTKGHEFYFDGNMVFRQNKDGKRYPCPKLLPQMDGEASYIQQEIEKRAEIKLPVTKVAVIVGSYIEGAENFKEYWLLNERSFITAFKKSHEVYDDSLVKLVAQHIREMVKIDVDG